MRSATWSEKIHRVVVFPMSGFGNRFQAIASAGLIARDLDAEFIICWEQQPVSPVPAEAVFAADFCAANVRTPEDVAGQFDIERSRIPLYLNVNSKQMMITLAGHDHGEQAHMNALSRVLDAVGVGYTLVFVAGGNFAFAGEDGETEAWRRSFAQRRGDFYAQMPLNDAVEASAETQHAEHQDSLGLHLRYSDRDHQAPLARSIAGALRTLRDRTGISNLFIAADSASARDSWALRSSNLGFRPWVSEHSDWDRTTSSAAHGALVDWRLMSRTNSAVYFTESTFAIEALVAGKVLDASIGLTPNPVRSAWVKGRRLGRNVVTYPRRHGWIR